MQNNYLIPANTKKSQLILGFFTGKDLTIFLFGCVLSLALLLLFASSHMGIGYMILMILPALIASFLVMPVPHYHNVLQLVTNVFNFYTNRRRYYWKGWCVYERFNSDDK